MDVKHTLQQLRELQRLELDLRAVESDLGGHPRRIAAAEKSLAGAQAAVEAAEADVRAGSKRNRELELDVEGIKQKISRHQDQLMQAKNNVEYKGLTKEIAHEQAQIEKFEDEILVLMEKADELASVLAEKNEVLAAEQQRVAGEKTEIEAARGRLDKESEQLSSEVAELRASVDPQGLAVYQRITDLRGNAIAKVDGELCAECRVRSRPQMLEEARTHQRLVQCEICSRILDAPPVNPNEQPNPLETELDEDD